MLTQQDLKQIEGIVERVVDRKLEEKLEAKLEEKLEKKLEEKLEAKLEPIRRDIAYLKKEVRKLRKDVDIILRFFDRETLELGKRVSRIEGHLKLPPIN